MQNFVAEKQLLVDFAVNSTNTAASLDRSITSVWTNDGSFYIQSICVYIPNQFEPLLDTNGSCHFTVSRRNTFVGGIYALLSAHLVYTFYDYLVQLLFSLEHCVGVTVVPGLQRKTPQDQEPVQPIVNVGQLSM